MSLASVSGVESLLLNGQLLESDIVNVLQDASISRTIDGASTLTLQLYDDGLKLLKSGLFSSRVNAQIDEFRFELVQVRKGGYSLGLTFEDLPVAALRRHTTPLKVAPNTTTHVDFAERLVKEEGWLNFWVPPGLRSAERAKVELSRGDPSGSDEPEDSWQALGRIADDRGWRRWVLNRDTIAYAPETFLLSQDPSYTLRENGTGVENIDFDFDSGKPVSTVRVIARASRWAVSVGSTVTLEDLGPADGKWLVSEVGRSLFSPHLNISLTKARPTLPEEAADATTPAATTEAVTQTTWPDEPSNLTSIGQGGHRLVGPAAASFKRVEKAFGRQIPITDSYRTAASQAANYDSDPSRFGKSSAHVEGRAVDVNLASAGVGNQSPDPRKWDEDATWKRLNKAFMAEGWYNYQYWGKSTKGKTPEPWHWSYQVVK